MFRTSFTSRFVQGAPLLLRGPTRGVQLLGYSRRLPFSGSKFKCFKTHMRNYPNCEIQPLTVSDYHVMIRAGCLDNYRVELLNGFLVKKFSQSPEHFFTVTHLDRTFFNALENENRAVVRQAAPITLMETESEPEPDIVIASGVPTDYKYRHPVANDILLVVEVSNATLRKDSSEKLELYASENIHEYWIVDVMRRSVRVLRNPHGKCYLHDETFCAGDIAPATFPDVVVNVENLF